MGLKETLNSLKEKAVSTIEKIIYEDTTEAARLLEKSADLLERIVQNPYSWPDVYEVYEMLMAFDYNSPVMTADFVNREALGESKIAKIYVENLLEAADVVLDSFDSQLFAEKIRRVLLENLEVFESLNDKDVSYRVGNLIAKSVIAERFPKKGKNDLALDELSKKLLSLYKEGKVSENLLKGYFDVAKDYPAGDRAIYDDLFFYSRSEYLKIIASHGLTTHYGTQLTPEDVKVYLSELNGKRYEKAKKVFELGIRKAGFCMEKDSPKNLDL